MRPYPTDPSPGTKRSSGIRVNFMPEAGGTGDVVVANSKIVCHGEIMDWGIIWPAPHTGSGVSAVLKNRQKRSRMASRA